jgi:nucleotide-binding universal stress UspA family protein
MEVLAERNNIDAKNVHLIADTPNRAISQLVESLQVDLLTIGSVSRGSLQRLIVGRTTERVLNAVACDVLVVRMDAEAPGFTTW